MSNLLLKNLDLFFICLGFLPKKKEDFVLTYFPGEVHSLSLSLHVFNQDAIVFLKQNIFLFFSSIFDFWPDTVLSFFPLKDSLSSSDHANPSVWHSGWIFWSKIENLKLFLNNWQVYDLVREMILPMRDLPGTKAATKWSSGVEGKHWNNEYFGPKLKT